MSFRNIRADVPVYRSAAELPISNTPGQAASTQDGKFYVFNGVNWVEKGANPDGLVTSVNGQDGVVTLTALDVGADPEGTAQGLFDTLGDIYVRTTRFELISSGTSGSVSLPPEAVVVLDDFGGTVDAVVSKVSSGKPTYASAKTSTNDVVATLFDSDGNWVLSGTPSSYPVAIIYRVRQKLSEFDSLATNIIGIPTTKSESADAAAWGDISGNIQDQTDLQDALDLKLNAAYFEAISKNLKTYPYTFNYTGDVLTSIVYSIGDGDTITKTLGYTSGVLTSITLSGELPPQLFKTTKTLTYTDGKLTSIGYT